MAKVIISPFPKSLIWVIAVAFLGFDLCTAEAKPPKALLIGFDYDHNGHLEVPKKGEASTYESDNLSGDNSPRSDIERWDRLFPGVEKQKFTDMDFDRLVRTDDHQVQKQEFLKMVRNEFAGHPTAILNLSGHGFLGTTSTGQTGWYLQLPVRGPVAPVGEKAKGSFGFDLKDGDGKPVQAIANAETNPQYVGLHEIIAELKRAGVRETLIVADGCHAGGAGCDMKAPQCRGIDCTVIASSGKAEKAYGSNFASWVEGLQDPRHDKNKDGTLSVQEMIDSLPKSLQAHVGNPAQSPSVYGKKDTLQDVPVYSAPGNQGYRGRQQEASTAPASSPEASH